jgi:hypothetical protein
MMDEHASQPLSYAKPFKWINILWFALSLGLLLSVPAAVALKIIDYDYTFAGNTYPLHNGVIALVTGIVLFGPPLGFIAACLSLRGAGRVIKWLALASLFLHGLLTLGFWFLFLTR